MSLILSAAGLSVVMVVPGITEIIFSPDIYIPLVAFFSLILVTIFLRKIFYKN